MLTPHKLSDQAVYLLAGHLLYLSLLLELLGKLVASRRPFQQQDTEGDNLAALVR